MKYEVRIAGKTRIVEAGRDANGWHARLDGGQDLADVAEITPAIFSVLLCGRSYEVCATPHSDGKLIVQAAQREFLVEVADPRLWSGRRHAGVEAEGRQPIVAPMPGKVVRLLVNAGDAVETGQGLLVVEAMKMQNEIRSTKSGTVERILVVQGQAVNAGDVLCIVG